MDTQQFDRYGVVAFAPRFIVEDLRKIRARCPDSTQPVLDACVMLAPVWIGGEVEKIVDAIDSAAEGTPPFQVRTLDPQVISGRAGASIVMPLEESKLLARLCGRVHEVIEQSSAIEDPEEAPFQFGPFVGVVRDIPSAGVEQALRAMAGWRVNFSWVVRDIDIVGRERGKIWRSIGRVSFGRRAVASTPARV